LRNRGRGQLKRSGIRQNVMTLAAKRQRNANTHWHTHTPPHSSTHKLKNNFSKRSAKNTKKKQQEKDIGGHALASLPQSLPTSTLAASI